MAASAADAQATSRLFELKGRSAGVPIAVLCADAQQALVLAEDGGDPGVRAVAERWWPGPLTLVVRRRPGLDLQLGEPAHTIGLRVPDHELVRATAARVGPLATTSANRHGEPTPATAEEAAAALGPGVDLVVDGGPLDEPPVDRASTRPPGRGPCSCAGAGDVSDILGMAEATERPAG